MLIPPNPRPTPIFDLAQAKTHAGSLIKIGSPTSNYIIPNYLYASDDKGIQIWRWLDAQHDFEKGLKTAANTLLRTHFGIGTRTDPNEFKKFVSLSTGNTVLVNNKTTSSKDVLHETVDFEELIPGLHDNATVTVSFPHPTAHGNVESDQQFTHILPTILPEINLADIPPGENLLVKYPAGDLLLDIIVNDKHGLADDATLAKLRTYLGITKRNYSKDAANINTQVFVDLFDKYDLSFFKEILDPASEQSDIVDEDVRITILFCYINGNTPIYITLEKRKGGTDKSKRTWYYRFHTGQIDDAAKFHEWDFGKTTSGAHPCPSIESTVHYITKNIDKRTATAGLQAISNFVSRQFNKVTAKSDKTKLSKGQLQNAEHYKFDAFNEFYKQFLTDFQKDIGLSAAQFTSDIQKMVLISFKTIGDQMYLYDAAILATMTDPQAGGAILKGGADDLDGIPTVVTGDTFLRDYIIYTKSSDLICPTTVDKTPGKRKLKVYLKPRNINAAQLAAASAAKAAAAQAAIDAAVGGVNNLQTEIAVFKSTEEADKIIMKTAIALTSRLIGIFESLQPRGATRRDQTLKYNNTDVAFNNKNVMALYYNILETLLLNDEYKILSKEDETIDATLKPLLNLAVVTNIDTIILINNYLRTRKQCLIRMKEIIARTTVLNEITRFLVFNDDVEVDTKYIVMEQSLDRIGILQEMADKRAFYDFNERLHFIKSYKRGASRKFLPYNVMEDPVANWVLITRVLGQIKENMPNFIINGGGKRGRNNDDDDDSDEDGEEVNHMALVNADPKDVYNDGVSGDLEYIATWFNAIDELVSYLCNFESVDVLTVNNWVESQLKLQITPAIAINPVILTEIMKLITNIKGELTERIIDLLADDYDPKSVYYLIDRYAEIIQDAKIIQASKKVRTTTNSYPTNSYPTNSYPTNSYPTNSYPANVWLNATEFAKEWAAESAAKTNAQNKWANEARQNTANAYRETYRETIWGPVPGVVFGGKRTRRLPRRPKTRKNNKKRSHKKRSAPKRKTIKKR
jgi:hypothetical protein